MGSWRLTTIVLLCVLLCATGVWAFPDTGIIDNFTAADDTSPPPNWTNSVLYGASCAGGTGIKVRSNGATTTLSSTAGCAYYNAATFGPDAEAYVTILATFGGSIYGDVCVRINTPGASTTTGYCVYFDDGAQKLEIYRLNGNGTENQIDTPDATDYTAGDSIGIKAVGSQICKWYKPVAGSWTQVKCATDSTYSAAGYVMMDLSGDAATPSIDFFSGGTLGGALLRGLLGVGK